MKKVKLASGLFATMLDDNEQAALWKELSQDISVVGKNVALFTPQDKLEYFIISETTIKYDSYLAVISANGKQIKVKYNVCNQDSKINAAVRKAYGK
jgi:hypothetical protein